MNRTKFLAVGLLGLGLAAFAQEQAAEPQTVTLTVEQAVDYALQNSRDLKSNDIALLISERAKKYSWNTFLPDVQATFTGARSTNIDSTLGSVNMGRGMQQLPPLSEEEKFHWSLVPNISASLNLTLAQIKAIQQAKAEYEGGKISWEQGQKQIIMGIKKLFYGLLLQQENLKIQRTSLENARQRAAQAQINFNNGRIPQLQLLNAQVSYENQRPEVETAEQNFNQQFDTFAVLIGMSVGTKIELSGSIDPVYVDVNTEELLEKYGEKSLEIRSAQNNIDVQKIQLSALNLSSYTPVLSIGYNFNPVGTWLPDLDWSDQGKFSFTLLFNITNILPWSANRQKASALKDGIAANELQLEKKREEQKANVRKAVDALNQARKQIDSMGRTVELARRSYDMSVRSFNNGLMELLDVRDAQEQLDKAMVGQLQQKFNYISALMDLENTLNIVLSDSQAAGQN